MGIIMQDFLSASHYNTDKRIRACLKIAFRQLCVPLCGRFGPDEGGVAGYVDRIGTKYTAKWGVLCPKGYLWWIP